MDDLASLTKLLAAAEGDERRLAAEKEKLELEYGRAKERSDLLRRLIGLADGPSSKEGGGSKASPEVRRQEQAHEARSLEDHIEKLLMSSGTPLHASAIRQMLIDAGVPLPGRGDEANVIVRLARDTDRFVRTGRGTYGLTSWGMSEVRPTRKRRVSR